MKEDKYVLHRYYIENGERKSDEFIISLSEWNEQQEAHPLWNMFSENLGIKSDFHWYLELGENQDALKEYVNINNFLNEYLEIFASQRNISRQDLKLEFINYGKTELVFVLTMPNGEQVTVLVKQPAVKFGKVFEEANNLIELQARDLNVVAPIDYYENGVCELYVTPYLKQARCIASDGGSGGGSWGVYVPEPIYRFDDFDENQANVINACMIAKLVELYDFDLNKGIASCKLGGGDFMLAKGYELGAMSEDWIFQNLFLIAAREKIDCSFDEYLSILRDEFSRRTIDEKQDSLKVNIRGRVPMTKSQIEKGILLGKKLLKARGIEVESLEQSQKS